MLKRFRQFLFKSRLHICLYSVLVYWVIEGLCLAMGWNRFSLLGVLFNTGFAILWGLAAFSMKQFVEEGYRKGEERKATRLARENRGGKPA